MCCKNDRPSDLFSKKLHCGLKKENYQYEVWKKKILQFLFGILINATFFQFFLVQELKKDLKLLIYITNTKKGEMNTMGLFSNK